MDISVKTLCLFILMVVAIHRQNVLAMSASGTGHYCSCVNKAPSLPWMKIRDFNLTERNDICDTEITVQMASGKIFCVDPDQPLGKHFQACWKKIRQEKRLKSKCLFNRTKKVSRS